MIFLEVIWLGVAEMGLNSRYPDIYFKVMCTIYYTETNEPK